MDSGIKTEHDLLVILTKSQFELTLTAFLQPLAWGNVKGLSVYVNIKRFAVPFLC